MPVISQVFLQAIALLAMAALISPIRVPSAYSYDPTTTTTSTTTTTTTTMAPTTTTTTTVSASYSLCPAGMTNYGNSCYGFGNIKLTWFEAQTVCQTVGASLAAIDSEEENVYLKKEAYANFGGISTWMGAIAPFRTKSSKLGSYVWGGLQGKVLPFSGQPGFQNWGPRQPNNVDGTQRCFMLYGPDNYRWHDHYCTNKEYYICELPLTMA